MIKNEINKYFFSLLNLFISRTWVIVLVFALIGYSLSFFFNITMNKDVWFWLFSTIAQTVAALVALVAVFMQSRIEIHNQQINKNIGLIRSLISEFIPNDKYDFLISDEILINTVEKIKSDLEESKLERAFLIIRSSDEINLLEQKIINDKYQIKLIINKALLIILISLILIPFGSLMIQDCLIFNFWKTYKLKWIFIFSVLGYCVKSIHEILHELKKFLFEDELLSR